MRMDKFEAHMARPAEVELERPDGTKDIFVLHPLDWEDMPELVKLMKKLSKGMPKIKNPEEIKEEDLATVMEGFDEETVGVIQKLVLKTLKKSYPEEKEEKLKAFAAGTWLKLFPKILEINLPR